MGKRIVHAGLVMLLLGLGLYGSGHTLDVQRERGDVNGDGAIDVLDAVQAIHIVLGTSPSPSGEELWAADCNGDGEVSVLDVLGIVNVILEIGTCVSSCDELDCDDGNPCTEDYCDSVLVQCRHEPLEDGTPCDDGDPHTENDMCIDGICGGTPRSLEEELQEALDIVSESKGVLGAAVAVQIPGHDVWVGTVGTSFDTTLIERDMIFSIASITKSFVATVILRLAEEGVLTLEDSLHQWLPANPNIDSTVTVRQLLNHTSGIHSYAWDVNMYFLDNPEKIWTPEEIITTLVEEPYFPPGTSFHYSNTNYILLGMIIRQATGSEVSTQLRNHILNPLGLNHTFLGIEEEIIGEIAHGWEDIDGDGQQEDLSMYSRNAFNSLLWTCGGMYSSAEDLVIFSRALFEGDLLTQSSLDQMLDFYPYPPDPDLGYGLGICIIANFIPGVRAIGHTGGIYGYVSSMVYMPDYEAHISVTVNASRYSNSPNELIANALAEVVMHHLGDEMTE